MNILLSERTSIAAHDVLVCLLWPDPGAAQVKGRPPEEERKCDWLITY